MWLADGFLIELGQLLRILLLVCLPLVTMIVAITTLVHYRRRKRKRDKVSSELVDEALLLSPEADTTLRGDMPRYVFVDHSNLIKQYKERLVYNMARYKALKQDHDRLQGRYTSLLTYKNPSIMQHSHLPESLPFVNLPENAHSNINEMDKEELIRQLQEMKITFQGLQNENAALIARVNILSEKDNTSSLSDWEEERIRLKTVLAEQEYLKDIVEEKKSEIVFLQEQLENRIKKHYAISREIQAKSDGMLYLENVMKELKQQNDLLQAVVADKTDEMTRLETELTDAREESTRDRKKLHQYKKSLQEIHREIGNFMSEEQVESPVITLQPVYETDDWSNAAL